MITLVSVIVATIAVAVRFHYSTTLVMIYAQPRVAVTNNWTGHTVLCDLGARYPDQCDELLDTSDAIEHGAVASRPPCPPPEQRKGPGIPVGCVLPKSEVP